MNDILKRSEQSSNNIINITNEKNEIFEELKLKSKYFSSILIQTLTNTFDKNHRIHEAILL